MQLETKRLVIREFTAVDAKAVHQYASDERVTRYMIWGPNSEEETFDFVQRTVDMQRQHPRLGYELAVELKENGKLIGGCAIHQSNHQQGEIGYCYSPRYWQQGYASEAASALLAFGFDDLGLYRIFATCRPENIGSAKVMQHIGMSYEGHLRGHIWHKGGFLDSYLYSILEPEYRAIRYKA
ncbi:GCN5 family acetyltransferase [Paenibacillus oryzae]|uniref:GCN5 family acetyltransferase n=1 Tax=Paenibacillus oryzae TaxID=1844972 RepID=A0A1A5YTF2_9BACL|nr:GNAT family protein [Paenibacillus oryzae]OBR68902.1 GCN5 family acetyltransferase [Paenibacillus oryzae]